MNEQATATVCDGCRLIPINHLSLDLDVPVGGWEMFLSEQGIDVMSDDLGRPSIARSVVGALLREQANTEKLQAERTALRAMEMAEVERRTPVPAGMAAQEGMTALETLMTADDYSTPDDEMGRPKVNWLADELARGAAVRAEDEALAKERAAARMRDDLG